MLIGNGASCNRLSYGSSLQMREKKKLVASLKEQLKELTMTNALDVRYQDKGSTAKNEHLCRLEQTELGEMRKELVLVSL